MNNVQNEIDRLNFEDWIFIIFIVAAILNIYGDQLLKKHIIENNKIYQERANKVFLVVIIITIFIYTYFLKRNYKLFINISLERKKLYKIKLLSSIFLLIGALCLLYFQLNDMNSSITPNI